MAKAKIKDVAKLAGVSTSTVSLVLNHKGYVSELTKKKVEEAVAALHYVPTSLIPSLRPCCTRSRLRSTTVATKR